MLAVKFLRCRQVPTLVSKLSCKHRTFKSLNIGTFRVLGTCPQLQTSVRNPFFHVIPCLESNLLPQKCLPQVSCRGFRTSCCSLKKDEVEKDSPETEEPQKLSLVKRYKKMLKEYWYVLIPVHIVTSTLWFGLFYYVAKSGFDIVPFLEKLSIPESVIKPFRNSSLGYIAVASALYKLATPARYMVTLGGTTVAIKQLTKRGLIKPVPSKDKFKTMIKDKLQSAKNQATKEKS